MRHRTTRRLQRIAVGTVIAAAPIVIISATVTDLLVPTEPLPRPVSYQVVPTAAIDNSNDTIGIADSDLYGMSNADIVKTLDEMQALGVDTIRALVPWGLIQAFDPAVFGEQYNWAKLDFIVNQAYSRDMAVLGVINATPYWGGANGGGCIACPGWAPDAQKYADFVGAVADRYAGKVSAYEIWNEPNYVQAWLPKIDPVAYTQVLKAAYTAIKAEDPDALVVGGVLGAVIDFFGITMSPVKFVETMYANGAQGYFDALSFHPYHYTREFSGGVANDPWITPREQLIAIRQLMITNGDAALKIWASEYGLPTGTFTINGQQVTITEQQQADFIADFLDAWNNLSYTGPAFIYSTIDRLTGSADEQANFGIFFDNWVAKLAAQVIKDAIAAGNEPPDPGVSPTDPLTALIRALTGFFQQVQATAQNFVAGINSFVNSIAQAVANLFGAFNPAAAALRLAPDQQAAVAEATMAAASSVTADTVGAQLSAVDATNDSDADTAAKVTAAEDVPAVDDTAVPDAAVTSEAAVTPATEAEVVETEDSETPKTQPSTVVTDPQVADTSTPNEEDNESDSTESEEPTMSGAAAESNGPADTGPDEKSREAVGSGAPVDARATKVGAGAEPSGTQPKQSTTTSDTGSSNSGTGSSDSGSSDSGAS